SRSFRLITRVLTILRRHSEYISRNASITLAAYVFQGALSSLLARLFPQSLRQRSRASLHANGKILRPKRCYDENRLLGHHLIRGNRTLRSDRVGRPFRSVDSRDASPAPGRGEPDPEAAGARA